MKKIISLALVIVMMLVSASAFAYSYTEYTYDESLFAEIGGEWLAFEDFGVMFYLPDVYEALEVPAEQVEAGVVGNFAISDLSGVLSISYGVAVDFENNPIIDLDSLANLYASAGMENVDALIINGLPVVMFTVPGEDVVCYALLFNDATQVVFTHGPASNAATAALAGLIMSSLQPVA